MFMEKEVDREEYVLADFGYIWVGSARRHQGIPWTFGQVNDKIPLFRFVITHQRLSSF